jgi:hypothetical protein
MRRALTAVPPALAAAAFAFASAMEATFLLSPAAGYCPEYGGILSYCLFPPREIAAFIIGLAVCLAAASVGSLFFAFRGHYGAAGGFALPGLFGVVLALVAALQQSAPMAEPLLNSPPPGYGFYEIGGYACLAGVILLGAACGLQLAVRLRRPSETAPAL